MIFNRYFFTGLLMFALTGAAAAAHIGFLMPSGARRGSTVDVIVGGQAFWMAREAFVSGKGVTVESVEFVSGLPNVSGSQRKYIHQVLRNYHAKKPNNIKKPENTEGWRQHDYYDKLYDLTDCQRDILYRFLLVPRNSLQDSPAISGRIIVRLKIAPDAPVGERELRIVARNGSLSNPLKFFVGNDPEFREEFFPYPPAQKGAVEFTIPCALNGQITPGETDSFKFKAARDEVITFRLLGRYFNAFIGDGVPGHFQAIMEIIDAQGKCVAFADDYFFDPDPVLTFKVPADGVYTLKVRDALYRGREDFVYRINVFKGQYLPPMPPQPEIYKDLPLQSDSTLSGGRIEKYPVMLHGKLQTPCGNNYFLNLKKDEEVVLEVFARRLGLAPDTVLKISNSQGKLLQFNDDTPRLKAGKILHNTADSMLIFKAPADDVYCINISDVAQAHGNGYAYYLRIDQLRERFKVYSVPSSLLLYAGTSNRITLVAERFDRFNGDIRIKVKKPSGFKFIGNDRIPAGCERAELTLSVPFDKKRPIQELELEAFTENYTVRVIPGNEAMQAFAYTHINPAETFPVRVTGYSRGMQWVKNPSMIEVEPGKNVRLQARMSNGGFPPDIELKLEPVELPAWVKLVPDKNSTGRTKLVKPPKKRAYTSVPTLSITLQGTPEARGKAASVLFKVSWVEVSKPDKDGKVRRYNRQLLLPAIYLKGN